MFYVSNISCYSLTLATTHVSIPGPKLRKQIQGQGGGRVTWSTGTSGVCICIWDFRERSDLGFLVHVQRELWLFTCVKGSSSLALDPTVAASGSADQGHDSVNTLEKYRKASCTEERHLLPESSSVLAGEISSWD